MIGCDKVCDGRGNKKEVVAAAEVSTKKGILREQLSEQSQCIRTSNILKFEKMNLISNKWDPHFHFILFYSKSANKFS